MTSGSADPWRISGEERAKHDAQFFQLKPVNGFVTGTQARDFFMQSGLSTQILGQIWTLADMNGDGKMDKLEFSVAMHLIKKKLQGYELPKVLPASLKVAPSPVIGSFGMQAGPLPMGQPVVMGIAPAMNPPLGSIPMSVGMMPQASLGTATLTTGSVGMPLMANGISPGMGPLPGLSTVPPAGAVSGWTLPHPTKLKYTQLFNSHDHNKRGFLTGVEARAILVQSGLSQPVLALIWTLSDVDNDGKLTCDEFCIAMHLTDMARLGRALPSKLPPELMPVKAPSGSFVAQVPLSAQAGVQQKDSFGDLLSGFGVGQPPMQTNVQQVTEEKPEEQLPVTFEDKRKENFDKGQAELDRRRALLQEQLKQEENARLEKERREAEKRERIRLEQEAKRQEELQRQLERQRRYEQEREEQRRKMMEQREQAKREVERQRQMEWERQRKEQLMAEKQREYEQLVILKSHNTNLKCELESLDDKKAEFGMKIVQVRSGVTDLTSSIEKMREQRDHTLADIDRFERETQELNLKLMRLSGEKEQLNNQLQMHQSTPMSNTYRTVMHSVELKRTNVQKLRRETEQLEQETEAQLVEIDESNANLKSLLKLMEQLQREIPIIQQQKQAENLAKERQHQEQLKKEIKAQVPKKIEDQLITNGKQDAWFDFSMSETKTVSNKTSGLDADVWSSAFSKPSSKTSSGSTQDVWGGSSSDPFSNQSSASGGEIAGKAKYKVMFPFEARDSDELSINPGEEVWLDEHESMPGMEEWFKGEKDGHVGWFPKAYVEKCTEPAPVLSSQPITTDVFGSAFQPVHSTNHTTSVTAIVTDSVVKPSVSPAADSSFQPTPGEAHKAPDGLKAQAVYHWKARQDNHLSFNKDDIILVKEQEDMWWMGELNGKVGWFPKAYVKLLPTDAAQISSQTSSPMGTLEKMGTVRDSPDKKDGVEYYVAMYSYTAAESTDLAFNEGDMIVVTKKEGDWWTGTLGDKSGMFPANYVKKLEIQEIGSQLNSSTKAVTAGQKPKRRAPMAPSSKKRPAPQPIPSSVATLGLKQDFAAFPQHSIEPNHSTVTSPQINTESAQFDFISVISESSQPPEAVISTNSSSGKFTDSDLFDFGQTGLGFNGVSVPAFPQTFSKEQSEVANTSMTVSLHLEPAFADFSSLSTQHISEAVMADKNSNGLDFDFAAFGNILPLKSDNSAKSDDSVLGKLNKEDSLVFSDDPFQQDPFPVTSPSLEIDFSSAFLGEQVFDKNFSSPLGTESIEADAHQKLNQAVPIATQTSIDSNLFELDFGNLETTFDSSKTNQDKMFPDVSASNMHSEFHFDNGAALSASSSTTELSLFAQVGMSDVSAVEKMPSQSVIMSGLVSEDSLPIAPPRFSSLIDSEAMEGFDEPGQKITKKPEIAMVIAQYVATGSGQLSLEPGNMIQVRQKSPRGWWEGELQARGQRKKIGWFPANYVKLLGSSSARSTPDPNVTLSLQIQQQNNSRSATPQPVPTHAPPLPPAAAEQVVSLYAYTAQNEDELSFDKEAVITVISRDNDDWWQGEINGRSGLFPSNYVSPLNTDKSWLSENVQVKLSGAEKQRQNYIQELITTEETYNADMSVVLEVFRRPMIEAKVLTDQEAQNIFVNWQDLIICNKKFLQALRVRKKMCGKGKVIFMIGDILCENLPHMTPYVRFCSCQLSAAALLQRKTETQPDFVDVHKKCVTNPACKGMPLSSYLLKPMQRITKYPLIIKQILKHTPDDHPDHGNLVDALQRAEELCSQVNEGVRQKENSDRLEWIQAHVHCDGIAENITFNSVTNCLGHRRLLHCGILYKVKSNKELLGFLFNDFLLLAVSPRPIGSSISVSHIFDTNTQLKMYKTPIVMNEVMVKKSTETDADPCQFQISHIERVYHLRTPNETERDLWLKHLASTSRQYLDTEQKKRERQHILKAKPVGRVLVIIEEGIKLKSTSEFVRRLPGVGRLLVVILEGCDLLASDATGRSDPYCEVSMGSQEHRTRVIPGTLNPKWNASMQFTIRDLQQDVLCITVYDRDLYSPNDFLGRTEVRVKEVLEEAQIRKGPITKRLILHEVDTGEVIVKLDLQLYDS